ncbi:hypothetical protein LO763_21735 [Glycomyces sp. A-F 0318]|uniref:hypothetical protein n=1 Tax=Glycomyces amatae TaxID=2881355 RepID=UPI001E52C3BD|nr:hypothetical protein [Glycomyces amatae]MCD0446237.1 hypothetical protein [Glycomyces amatae]
MACKAFTVSSADEPEKYAKDVSKHVRNWNKLSKREKEIAALEAIGAWPRPHDENQKKNRKTEKRRKK